mmetsp:Transcript_17024/g.41800  ORF Transcript_17024/g.41800 Transcript_17024/m.41800 type:complete len:402 (+) Transcript_17024:3-1208(+)
MDAGEGGGEEEEEEEEKEDLRIRETDAVVVAVRSDEDASHLEVYVYEDDDVEPNLYVHHDVVLPTFPLCLAWTGARPLSPGGGDGRGNFCATGTFLPAIDIWDVDDLESLEPVLTLGGLDLSSKKAQKRAAQGATDLPLLDGSHSAAVMSLSWNPVDIEYLASGSADTTVKCWDAETGACVQTLRHHADKVQSVAWHPSERGRLLTAGFDKVARVADARSADCAFEAPLGADVEVCQWRPGRDNEFVASLENGKVVAFDTRAGGSVPLWSIAAHKEAVSGLSLCSAVPDFMATGSTTKNLKLWDLATPTPTVLHEENAKAGAIFGLAFCNDGQSSPFLLAAVGSDGNLSILDTALLSESLRHRYHSVAPAHVEAAQRRVDSLAGMPDNAGEDNDAESNDSG